MRFWLAMLAMGVSGVLLMSTGPTPIAAKDRDKAKDKDKDKAKDKEPPKGPTFPPVNPAIAKLDMTISGLDGPGFAIAYGATEPSYLVAACERGTMQVFRDLGEFKGGAGKPQILAGHSAPVRAIAWNGGPVLASIGADNKIDFWKMPEGKLTSSAPLEFRVRAAVMSSDGKSIATAGEKDVIQLWDPASGKPTAKLTDKMDWSLCVAYSADGKQLVSGDYAGVVRLWDVAGAKKIKDLPAPPMPAPKPPLPDPVPATCVAFAPDGKTVVMGTAEGKIEFINVADGKILRTLVGHTAAVTGIVFHPTGTLMASCSKDRTVKLWNPAAPAPLKSLDGHNAWIEGIVFMDHATKLATVSADATVKIWDLTEAKKK